MRHLKYIVFGLLFSVLSLPLLAQDVGIDFENIRVDQLSDSQITQLYQRMQDRGLSISEVEQLALARGMDPAEVSKLRRRINDARSSSGETNQTSVSTGRSQQGQPQGQ